MGKGSQDPGTGEALERAERTLRRRARDGERSFTSVRAALGWFWATKERMQAPNNMHPDPNRIDVDGGRGSALDDVHVTLVTIAEGLTDLKFDRPQGYHALVAYTRDGRTCRDIARQMQCAVSTAGNYLASGESYMLGMLRQAGIVR